MLANLPAARDFPYANWGAGAAILALFAALSGQVFFAIPVGIVDGVSGGEGELSDAAAIVLQAISAALFVAAPLVLASMRSESLREALRRLGVRGFRPSAFGWMFLAVVAYLAAAALYVALVGEPEQEDIAEAFGPVGFQILLIAIAAPISEELCFRGMVFGGLRARMPRLGAALVSGAIFGLLHAFTGLSAVPPLIAFGFIMALLYERTGSIVPGILLHMLNNSAALLAQ